MSRWLNTETCSGLLVIAMGAFGLFALGDLEIGVPTEMGPGYLPRLVAWLILAGGVLLTGWGLAGSHEPLPPVMLRPLLAISAATAVFGMVIDRWGMVVAVVAMTVLASLASPISRPRETPIVAAVMAIGAVIVFIYGLKLAIPVWPR